MRGHLVAFCATTNAAAARTFYVDVLGLSLRYEDEYAISLGSDGVEVRLQKVQEFTPQPFTALGWEVPSIADVVASLQQHGVAFERYPWMEQDASGVWLAPSGARIAWFKDPDGNLLSVAQYPAK